MKRILVVLGTRPEVIKLAPVVHTLSDMETVETRICSTAQHREMLDDALRAFELEPEIDLALMRDNQRLGELFGRMSSALDGVLTEETPDIVVVQGDTLTGMAASVVAFLCGAKVAHVEAGLRTNDKRRPFPEEVSRRVAGVVADWHFAPTEAARAALEREGTDPATIRVTGNTGIDALYWMRERVRERPLPAGVELDGKRLVLVTAHRRENFGQPLREAFGALRTIADTYDDVQLVYPVHLNPNVQGPAHELLGGHERITLLDPVSYPELVGLLDRSQLVITDSGGLQEEAPSLGKNVIVLREETERPEALAYGSTCLAGTSREKILAATEAALASESPPARHVYGDGRASTRIAEALSEAPTTLADFVPDAPPAGAGAAE